jgi:hypothetical protein
MMMKVVQVVVAICCISMEISAFVPHSRFTSARKSTNHLEMKSMRSTFIGGLIAASFLLPIENAIAETIMEKNANFVYKLPPIDRKNPERCKLLSSSIGQANAARDSLYDLRECDIRGQNAEGKDQSGMIASDVS